MESGDPSVVSQSGRGIFPCHPTLRFPCSCELFVSVVHPIVMVVSVSMWGSVVAAWFVFIVNACIYERGWGRYFIGFVLSFVASTHLLACAPSISIPRRCSTEFMTTLSRTFSSELPVYPNMVRRSPASDITTTHPNHVFQRTNVFHDK